MPLQINRISSGVWHSEVRPVLHPVSPPSATGSSMGARGPSMRHLLTGYFVVFGFPIQNWVLPTFAVLLTWIALSRRLLR